MMLALAVFCIVIGLMGLMVCCAVLMHQIAESLKQSDQETWR